MDYSFEALRTEYKAVLKQAFKKNDTNLIENKVKSINRTDLDLKSPLDQAFRDFLLELIENETQVNKLKDYIKFCIEICRNSLATSTMPVVLLGDIFEVLTLEHCKEMFEFVEDNVHIWKEDMFFTGCKNNLLRLCNDLLRRLSRSTETVFCGKILLFLAKFFPFSERSGLNIVSEFNLENVTEYEENSTEDKISEIPNEQKPVVIDFSFYCKFWKLQDFFRNPNQCYNKGQWKLFISNSASILNSFQGIKLDYVNCQELNTQTYFAKYLTSPKLLDLQLLDVNFRRSVLLQFLIVFQYLRSSVKFKSESYELKADQKEWIQTNTEKIYNLLRETPPDGEEFAKIAKNILTREELWNSWKNDGCPEIKKSVLQNTEVIKKGEDRPLLGNILKEADKEGRFYMGSGELTKLWNQCPNNLEACKVKERDFLPSLEDYFSDAITQLESNNTTIKDDENLLKDGNFGWRALRLLARRSPHFFTYSNTIMNPLSSYLEMMVWKIAQERPGRVQENTDHNDELEESLLEEEQATEELKPETHEYFVDDNNPRQESKNVTEAQLSLFSSKIAPDWTKLAPKLGYSAEIEWFKSEHETEQDQARHMLQLWFADDEDATLENFLYILDGLELTEAADSVRNEINNAMET